MGQGGNEGFQKLCNFFLIRKIVERLGLTLQSAPPHRCPVLGSPLK